MFGMRVFFWEDLLFPQIFRSSSFLCLSKSISAPLSGFHQLTDGPSTLYLIMWADIFSFLTYTIEGSQKKERYTRKINCFSHWEPWLSTNVLEGKLGKR